MRKSKFAWKFGNICLLVCRYPGEVVITDAAGIGANDGTSTPAGEPEDDFFSSWDKPTIKRPTPPVSRTATPPVVGRIPSPFISSNGNGNGISRTQSPLVGGENSAAPRTTSSAAIRKSAITGAGPRKTNVLGAKKATKLGAKKLGGDVIDFDAAERKAKEEAERIEKLGYDPEAEEAATKKPAAKVDAPSIVAPTPLSPARQSRDRGSSDVERLGMGIGRLGFGQIGGGAKPAAQKKMGGFGSVGPIKAAQEGKSIGR